jgi:DsbC/DsbD-like thiol-disulfide interchange protein
MTRASTTALSLLALLLASTPAPAQLPPTDLVKATLLADTDAATPGGAFTLGVRLRIKSPWHVYWLNPGDTGDPTKVKLTGPAGVEFGAVQFPIPTKLTIDGGTTYAYENDLLLLVPVKLSKDLPAGTPVKLTAAVSWLACHDTCIEGSATPTLTLPVQATANPANADLFATWRQRLPSPADRSADTAVAAVRHPAANSFTVDWKTAPAKVDWYPLSTPVVAIENVTVNHTDQQTQVTFKPKIYKPDQLASGQVDGVLVYEDAAGKRHGVHVPITVSKDQK